MMVFETVSGRRLFSSHQKKQVLFILGDGTALFSKAFDVFHYFYSHRVVIASLRIAGAHPRVCKSP